VRVTLVAAAPREGATTPRVERLSRHAPAPALRLGAEVRWQGDLPVEKLTGAGAIVVSCRLQPEPPGRDPVRWILVPRPLWTSGELVLPMSTSSVLSYPLGSADNRWSRRQREQRRRVRVHRDEVRFARLCADSAAPRAGSFVARPKARGRIHLEALA
jgi:hypothetical protein